MLICGKRRLPPCLSASRAQSGKNSWGQGCASQLSSGSSPQAWHSLEECFSCGRSPTLPFSGLEKGKVWVGGWMAEGMGGKEGERREKGGG